MEKSEKLFRHIVLNRTIGDTTQFHSFYVTSWTCTVYHYSLPLAYQWVRENWKDKELCVSLSSSFVLCNHFLHRCLAATISYLSCICFASHWILFHPWSTRILLSWSIINAVCERCRKETCTLYIRTSLAMLFVYSYIRLHIQNTSLK